jgi:hypothetical protein
MDLQAENMAHPVTKKTQPTTNPAVTAFQAIFIEQLPPAAQWRQPSHLT